MASTNNLSDKLIGRVQYSVSSFYRNFQHLLTEEDDAEKFFRIKLETDVLLVGKMDRVVKPSGLVLDWKTSASSISNINDDVQFLIYYYAYTRLYNKPPSLVAYVSLLNEKLISLNIERSNYSNYRKYYNKD